MGLFDRFWPTKSAPAAHSRPQIGEVFASTADVGMHEFMRAGGEGARSETITPEKSLENMAILRCVSLISESIGMLPLNLMVRGDQKAYAKEHPLYRILKQRPNEFQGPYKFKSTMQLRALTHGNAYARVIWRGNTVIRLIPLDSKKVEPKMNDDFTVRYEVQIPGGGKVTLKQRDILHIADLADDEHGLIGMSRVKKARESVSLAFQAEKAASRIFKNGVMAGGALTYPKKLDPDQIENIRNSLETRYAGSNNAHKWMVLEDGITAEKWANSALDSQLQEARNHQTEEIARAFGVPRPLLMMDDTSWGSGIEQLGIFFIAYGLQHWFEIWEDAIENTLLSEQERDTLEVKFNPHALMRGTLKDQSEFFAKALGSGGSQPYMNANEVRDKLDMPKSDEPAADSLQSPMMRNTNVPVKTA
ncbi:phage portal protein [Massilia sp. DWR3-1-1]|uniref:phage portal protein n=1 Tax=Massilia sp. DWR3-1-1 TaxID=2804559 RepID=UPI003CE73FA8